MKEKYENVESERVLKRIPYERMSKKVCVSFCFRKNNKIERKKKYTP